jgi:hypothetical protein
MLERLKNGWTHMGFLYRTETSGGPFVLHLRGHYDLRHDPPEKGQICVLSPVEPIRIPALAALARRVWRKNRHHGIPYAFSSPEHDWFNKEGQLIIGADQLGLTCSNFVLAIYRAAGLPLVQLDTWPAREEDAQWQAGVIETWKAAVKGDGRKLRHLEKMRGEIGIIRCRPLEAGGAALSVEIPCAFSVAIEYAEQIKPMFA